MNKSDFHNFYGRAYNLCKDKELSMELTHEAWARAAHFCAEDRDSEAFKKYWMSCIKTVWINFLKKKKREKKLILENMALAPLIPNKVDQRDWEAVHDMKVISKFLSRNRKIPTTYEKIFITAIDNPGYDGKRVVRRELKMSPFIYKRVLKEMQNRVQEFVDGV